VGTWRAPIKANAARATGRQTARLTRAPVVYLSWLRVSVNLISYLDGINHYLMRWATRKFKRLRNRVDGWRDDERFLARFVPFFDARIRRPSTLVETYLRLMFLKHRYRLGVRVAVC
jgi:hypothetical protein